MEKLLLTCETCGGVLNYAADGKSAICPFCGNEYFFKEEKSEALILALNRANAYRLANDFDGAITEYKLVAERNPSDAEAFWGLAISTYGIEYVEDPRTKKRVPTCRRTVKKSILEDENYLKALENASDEQKEVYERRAAVIDRLQKNIKRRLEDEEDFDVFISFKSTDENGNPTKERGVARRIYDELTKRKIKTFFSEVTLRDRIGEDFEPIIFKALYSCKFFILVAASEENMNSAWVKNEWSRYRDRVFDENLSGAGCAVFEGIKPSALPAFLRGQGINLAKYPAGGYEIEIADALSLKFGLTKKNDEAEEIRRQIEEQKRVQKALEEKLKAVSSSSAAPAAGAGATVNSLLMRAKQESGDGDFAKATSYYNKVLDADPVNFEAWLGLFFVTQNTTEERGLLFKKESLNAAQFYESEKENERLLSTMKGKYFTNAKKYADSEQLKRIQAAEERSKKENEQIKTAMALNLQAGAEKRIAQSDFGTATPMLDAALTVFPEKAELWWDKFLAEVRARSAEELLSNMNAEKYELFYTSKNSGNAVIYASGAFEEKLKEFCIKADEFAEEDARRLSIKKKNLEQKLGDLKKEIDEKTLYRDVIKPKQPRYFDFWDTFKIFAIVSVCIGFVMYIGAAVYFTSCDESNPGFLPILLTAVFSGVGILVLGIIYCSARAIYWSRKLKKYYKNTEEKATKSREIKELEEKYSKSTSLKNEYSRSLLAYRCANDARERFGKGNSD